MHTLGIRSAVSRPANAAACAAVAERLEGGFCADWAVLATWDSLGLFWYKGERNREDETGRVRRILLVRIKGAISVYQLFSHEWLILPRFVYTITGRIPEVKVDKALLLLLQYVNMVDFMLEDEVKNYAMIASYKPWENMTMMGLAFLQKEAFRWNGLPLALRVYVYTCRSAVKLRSGRVQTPACMQQRLSLV